ncbi:putative spermidine/putrescine transport system permease protein [Rhizobiales bacterium GAS113]|nr:putative spermidine/putrescine transport system permease protein [Rhizobiales bacterium GAS113]
MRSVIGDSSASFTASSLPKRQILHVSGSTLAKLLVAPAILFLVLLFFYPLWTIASLSLNLPDLSVASYQRYAASAAFIGTTERTFVLSIIVTLICLLLGYPTAAFLSRMAKEGRTYLLVCVILPYLTSLLIRTYAWMVLLGDDSPINKFLMLAGFTSRPVPLLFSTTGALIGMVHIMLPAMILPIYSVIHGMDREQMRAASALGGGPFRAFFKVFLPQSLPGVRSGCTLVFALSLGFYVTPAALGSPKDAMLSNLIASLVTGALDFRYASAISIVLLALTLLVYFAMGGGLGSVVDRHGGVPARSRLGAIVTAPLRALENSSWLTEFNRRLWQRRLGRSGSDAPIGRWGVAAFGLIVLVFLIVPSVIVVVMSFSGEDMLSFPPASWSLRWYQAFFADNSWISATGISAKIAVSSSAIALVLGTMAAYGLARGNVRGRQFLYALVLAPIIVPSVVTAVGMFNVLAAWGFIGTTTGVLLAHTPGAISYVVIILSGTLMGLDRRLEMASMSLGASHLRTAFRVVLPLIAPGMLAAAIFAFIHSFDEVVISSFVAGANLQTLPLRIWQDIQYQVDPVIAAVSAMLMLIPVAALPLMRRRGSGVAI